MSALVTPIKTAETHRPPLRDLARPNHLVPPHDIRRLLRRQAIVIDERRLDTPSRLPRRTGVGGSYAVVAQEFLNDELAEP